MALPTDLMLSQGFDPKGQFVLKILVFTYSSYFEGVGVYFVPISSRDSAVLESA
jgi:hypothetical protein